jgi:hypothetical protein
MDSTRIPIYTDQADATYRTSVPTSHTGKLCPIIQRHIGVFLPLLALYLAIAVIASSPAFVRDEDGYIQNASRMVHGPAVSPQDLRLWWGPGYTFVLIPFIVLRLPWIAAKCFNAGFLFGAAIYFYRLIQRYIPGTAALVITFALGLYLCENYPTCSPNA